MLHLIATTIEKQSLDSQSGPNDQNQNGIKMAEANKLFNIRMTQDKHKRFKQFAEKNNVSIGGILLNYIDELLDGDAKIIGFEDGRKTAKWADPLDAIRGQYTPGEDF